MSKVITKSSYFNPDGCEIADEKLVGSEPVGFTDFNRSRYKWASNGYDTMLTLTWFNSEVNTTNEKKSFSLLSDDEKELYKHTFAQLSFLDSAQEQYSLDIRNHITNNVAKSALVRLSFEESLHSQGYAQLLDVVGNSTEVFDMYQTSDLLRSKNEKVAEMFSKHINGTTARDILLATVGAINLEGIFFLTGFGVIHLLGDKMQGSRDLIKFISRDELISHTTLFKNIFKGIHKENRFDYKTIDMVKSMISEATEIELEYTRELLKNKQILGGSMREFETAIKNFANGRLEAIGLDQIYPKNSKTNIEVMVDRGSKELNSIRTGLFEGNNANYSKGSLDMDF